MPEMDAVEDANGEKNWTREMGKIRDGMERFHEKNDKVILLTLPACARLPGG